MQRPKFYAHMKDVAVELTNNCNLKCAVCWSQSPRLNAARPKGFMSEELFKKVIDELAIDAQYHNVALHYAGEATLHPKFDEFSRYAKSKNFASLTLATNGLFFSEQRLQLIAECYNPIAVSLHNSPYLPQAVNTLVRLRRMKCDARANIIVDELTASQLNIIRTMPFPQRVFSAISEDMKCTLPRTPYYPVCPSKFYYLAVLWNGETLPCCHILSPGAFSLGNANEQSLHDIFYGYKAKRLRKGYEKNTPCLGCEVRR